MVGLDIRQNNMTIDFCLRALNKHVLLNLHFLMQKLIKYKK